MLARLHLVRHGEVHNPDGVVYSDLPGFPLSILGRHQAEQAADHLADSGATVVATSPLQRATETAGFIGRRLGIDPQEFSGLTEWGLSLRWAGTVWERLEERFPGELAQYFAHPDNLPFSPESLGEAAARTAAVVTALGATHPGAVAVVVSHQDP
ncbi:MAG TPA: histidine phosphatase family protein, partial [Acidimicrobiia bacterium]|nr:histidine phosphatase family protein [Acidimicrobiia bacterium]